MLSLPYNGTCEFEDAVANPALLAHLADCMRRIDAREIRTLNDGVSFRGGVFRWVNQWNVLIPI
jgi:hypothetical protein